jgi:hypothetical protein
VSPPPPGPRSVNPAGVKSAIEWFTSNLATTDENIQIVQSDIQHNIGLISGMAYYAALMQLRLLYATSINIAKGIEYAAEAQKPDKVDELYKTLRNVMNAESDFFKLARYKRYDHEDEVRGRPPLVESVSNPQIGAGDPLNVPDAEPGLKPGVESAATGGTDTDADWLKYMQELSDECQTRMVEVAILIADIQSRLNAVAASGAAGAGGVARQKELLAYLQQLQASEAVYGETLKAYTAMRQGPADYSAARGLERSVRSAEAKVAQAAAAEAANAERTRLSSRISLERARSFDLLQKADQNDPTLATYEKELRAAAATALNAYESTQRLGDLPAELDSPANAVASLIEPFLTLGPDDVPTMPPDRQQYLQDWIRNSLGKLYSVQLSQQDFDTLWTTLWKGTEALRDELAGYAMLMADIKKAAAETKMRSLDDSTRAKMVLLVDDENVHSLQNLNPACRKLAQDTKTVLTDKRYNIQYPQSGPSEGMEQVKNAVDTWLGDCITALREDGFEEGYKDTTNLAVLEKEVKKAIEDPQHTHYLRGYMFQLDMTMRARSDYRLIGVESPFGYNDTFRVDTVEMVEASLADGASIVRCREYKNYAQDALQATKDGFDSQLKHYEQLKSLKMTRPGDGPPTSALEYVFYNVRPKWVGSRLTQSILAQKKMLWCGEASEGDAKIKSEQVAYTPPNQFSGADQAARSGRLGHDSTQGQQFPGDTWGDLDFLAGVDPDTFAVKPAVDGLPGPPSTAGVGQSLHTSNPAQGQVPTVHFPASGSEVDRDQSKN